ncbi:hypothetical protein ABIE44_001750 [Marmoricola sp. OAE513]|uniref:SHOCT domain-containing protein n=1 Tax=Marmoricola sp. OAE513 TaxID=2817894 RepID=UPI001AE61A39
MSRLGFLRFGVVAVLCTVTLSVAGPASADQYSDLESASDGGVPGGFVAFFVIVALFAVGATIWKVVVARDLARQSGMDPDVATGMTLLDDNGLSATYLASSLRTNRPYEDPNLERRTPPEAPKGTATERLEELKRLLDAGLITLVEYDTRRTKIIDSL